MPKALPNVNTDLYEHGFPVHETNICLSINGMLGNPKSLVGLNLRLKWRTGAQLLHLVRQLHSKGPPK
jgi:hypothetical protein